MARLPALLGRPFLQNCLHIKLLLLLLRRFTLRRRAASHLRNTFLASRRRQVAQHIAFE